MSDWLILPEPLQRLWIVHSVARDKSLLNIGANVVIEGPCSSHNLEAAFRVAVTQHDAFRLRFRLGKAGPECQPLDTPIIQWRVLDLGYQQDLAREGVHCQIAECERLPFSPADGHLVRATLYQMGGGLAVLAVTAHHLIADAWTIRTLVQDILYQWRRIQGEAVSSRPHPGSFLEFLRSCPCAASGVPMRSGRASFKLPLDHIVVPEERSGKGGEVAVRLDRTIYDRFRRRCAEVGQTPFAGLTGALFILLAQVCRTSNVEAGIVVTTRDLRRHRRTAGCFVHAALVASEIRQGGTPSQVIRDIGLGIQEVWAEARWGQLLPGTRFPVMISMVRDSSVCLHGPQGVSLRYERRRRTQAECDLHVFIYDHADGVEVVFNYDADVLTVGTAKSWTRDYLQLVELISESPQVPIEVARCEGEAGGFESSVPTVACRLQHVGLAAWELDIGLRRLESVGVALRGQPWVDSEAGVAMALTGPAEGIQFEVVAPMRENAPCVGALMRDGEGPYHCCWRVSDADAMLGAMKRSRVEHTVIRRSGKSGLFPSETITFVVVQGFGLIELLHGVRADEDGGRRSQNGAVLWLGFESDDVANARRFLLLAGYNRRGAAGQDVEAEVWTKGFDRNYLAKFVRGRSS